METSLSQTPRNPYIGPAAFQTGERLYGRDRELSQLTNLIVAERIVLLHSPSGAGKTSLIQAALIPRLRSMRFQVLPVIRVNQETLGKDLAANRYVLSTLLYLNAGLPVEEQIPADRLAQMTLSQFMDQQPVQNGKPGIEVLIFDQFEEILTLDPTDQAAKQEFFRQLGEVLEDPRRWALIAMREDYVAALAPYEVLVPSQMHNHFRLDLLSSEEARQAIERPAQDVGVIFEEHATDKLVDDLRRVRVQRTDGSFDTQLGQYVEPVQLQVVCYRLWENARPQDGKITLEDLSVLDEVDRSLVDYSLGAYYAASVRATAEATGVSERAIREWFDRQLITEQGVRGSVLMGEEQSGNLDNRAVRMLENAYLVRAEKRAGITWFELAHDRLIAPVRAENAAWFRANLNLTQQQADLWNQRGRPESLLMTGPQLAQARAWSQQQGVALLPYEADFLAASEKQEARARRLRRLNLAIAVLGVVAILFALLTWLAYRQAVIQRSNAEQQTRIALANQLAAQSQAEREENPLRSLLLAVEAVRTTGPGEISQPSAEEALRAALRDPHGLLLPGHSAAVTALAFSPDGKWLATGSEDATVRLWDTAAGPSTGPAADPAAHPLVLSGHSAAVTKLVFSPDSRWLVTGSKDHTVRLWDLASANPGARSISLDQPQAEIISLAISPDGKWLAAAGLEQGVWLWQFPGDPTQARPVSLTQEGVAWALAFSPDSRSLASSDSENIRLWDLAAGDPAANAQVLRGHQGLVTSLAFSPDNRWLASGSRDHTARLWDLRSPDTSANAQVLDGPEDWVNALAFSPDGQRLAAGSGDATVRLWNVAKPDSAALVLRGHTRWISALAFSADGRWLASGSGDRSARLWDLQASDPGANPVILRGHDEAITSLAFQPGGGWLATGSADHTARLWEVDTHDPLVNPQVLRGINQPIAALAFSSDGKWLAAAGGDPAQGSSAANAIQLWAVEGAGPLDPAIRLDGFMGWVSALAFHPELHWLASGGGSEGVRLWDLQPPDANAAPTILGGQTGWVWSLAFSPDGRWLVSGSEDGAARVWDLRAADPGAQPLVLQNDGRVRAVAFSAGGRWLATASDQTVRLWDVQSVGVLDSPVLLEGHTDTVTAMAFSPDGKWLATASRDSTVRLWDLNGGPVTRNTVLKGHSDWVNTLAFSPDGRWLATGSTDRTARLWDLSTQDPSEHPRVLTGHNGPIQVVTFSPDGLWLATGSEDATARLWSMAGDSPGSRSVALRDHSGAVTALAFSPDSRWLATGSQDQTVRLWVTRLDELVANACKSAGRNFTQEEWQRFFPDRPYAETCAVSSGD